VEVGLLVLVNVNVSDGFGEGVFGSGVFVIEGVMEGVREAVRDGVIVSVRVAVMEGVKVLMLVSANAEVWVWAITNCVLVTTACV
jgi:hypothetical protein